MKFLIILCMLSSSLYAQKSLGPQAFQSSIRPTLKGILHEFYEMVSLFPDFPRPMVSIVDLLGDLQTEKDLLRGNCPHVLTLKCLSNINKIKGTLSSIVAKSLELATEQKMSQSLYINTVGGLRVSNDFFLAVEEVKGELENASLKLKAQVAVKDQTHTVLKQLDHLNTLISLSVVEYVPYAYREDFRHFFFNFVHPIQLHINKANNHEFFYRNINSLNFALNLLNQNLTKRNKKTPEGMAPYLSLMHNRWNGILRYYF